jgi:hypothetical protein
MQITFYSIVWISDVILDLIAAMNKVFKLILVSSLSRYITKLFAFAKWANFQSGDQIRIKLKSFSKKLNVHDFYPLKNAKIPLKSSRAKFRWWMNFEFLRGCFHFLAFFVVSWGGTFLFLSAILIPSWRRI